tara:strand:+ start:213157 stop:213699 length:543 start_codon:yes stop_codon:yes gene_type:complete
MNQIQQFLEYLLSVIRIWVIVQPWESGLIVRNGKRIKEIEKGIYFKIPYFDSVYVQEVRLRVTELPMQTLTSKDLKTITVNSSIGYSITNVRQLYQTLFHPETTIKNIAMSEVAELIFNTNQEDLTPRLIEDMVLKKLKENDYGLEFSYFRITNFAIVRTYRLIQDQTWSSETLYMNEKK